MSTSVWTLEELDEQIAAYKGVLRSLSESPHREVSHQGHTYTKRDLEEVRKHLDYLAAERDKLNGLSGPRVFRVVV